MQAEKNLCRSEGFLLNQVIKEIYSNQEMKNLVKKALSP